MSFLSRLLKILGLVSASVDAVKPVVEAIKVNDIPSAISEGALAPLKIIATASKPSSK